MIKCFNMLPEAVRRFWGFYWQGAGFLYWLAEPGVRAPREARLEPVSEQRRLGVRLVGSSLFFLALSGNAFAQAAGGLDQFLNPLHEAFNLIVAFGFVASVVTVMVGFLHARQDPNWKMTVIYGLGVAGATVLMKALFALFGGNSVANIAGF